MMPLVMMPGLCGNPSKPSSESRFVEQTTSISLSCVKDWLRGFLVGSRLFILRYLPLDEMIRNGPRRLKLYTLKYEVKKSNSLLQLFLGMGECAAGSSGTASFLLHISTHVGFILAMLRGLMAVEAWV